MAKSARAGVENLPSDYSFPKDELYGLTSQIRRAASSIPANIAEGCGRDTQTELARFVQFSK